MFVDIAQFPLRSVGPELGPPDLRNLGGPMVATRYGPLRTFPRAG
jgi:hypothetical protein